MSMANVCPQSVSLRRTEEVTTETDPTGEDGGAQGLLLLSGFLIGWRTEEEEAFRASGMGDLGKTEGPPILGAESAIHYRRRAGTKRGSESAIHYGRDDRTDGREESAIPYRPVQAEGAR